MEFMVGFTPIWSIWEGCEEYRRSMKVLKNMNKIEFLRKLLYLHKSKGVVSFFTLLKISSSSIIFNNYSGT